MLAADEKPCSKRSTYLGKGEGEGGGEGGGALLEEGNVPGIGVGQRAGVQGAMGEGGGGLLVMSSRRRTA